MSNPEHIMITAPVPLSQVRDVLLRLRGIELVSDVPTRAFGFDGVYVELERVEPGETQGGYTQLPDVHRGAHRERARQACG